MRAQASSSPATSTAGSQLTPLSLECLAHDADLRAQWRSMLARHWGPYTLYASPEWFDHVRHTGREELGTPLALLGEGGRLDGLALPYRKRHLLPFQIRNYSLWRLRLRTVGFLGAEPLLPQRECTHDELLAAALASDPQADGIYLHSVPTDGFFWSYLQRSAWVAKEMLIHVPDGVRRFHALELPSSFAQYLATQFRKKKRYNLNRQLRLLAQSAGGDVELRRIESVEEVAWFAGAAGRVARASWQGRRMIPDTFNSLLRPVWLEDLARRGLLRSYVLLCAGTPCAMALGYQVEDAFHYSETSYDERFARFSPGAVLLYLMIADLIAHHPPRWMSFGAGDSRYKAEFSNRHWGDAPVLLLRGNTRGALVRASHACFRGTIEWIKRKCANQSEVNDDSAREAGE